MIKVFFIIYIACSLIFTYGACAQNTRLKQTEVLVIGGTTSGISAGLQSARLNVPTLIVEETPWLGGMLTAAGVSATDGNHKLHSGIWNEFHNKLISHYGGEAALATGWVSNTQFEPHVGDSIFKSMAAAEKKLSVIYGFHLTKMVKVGNRVIGAVFENEYKRKLTVHAKVVIDATDLGDGLAMAGAPYDLGMESRLITKEDNAPESAKSIVQDLTWAAILKDYGKGANKSFVKPKNYNPEIFRGSCSMTVDSVLIDCEKMLKYGRLPNNKFMINWPRKGNDIYLNVVEMDWSNRRKELIKAKERTLCFIYYIQTELGYISLGLADDEFTSQDLLPFLPYHREGRRLHGIQRLTLNEVLNIYSDKPLYRTGISVGDYPVDHHHACNPDAPQIRFPAIPSFNIPLGALITEKIDGLIVSDKAISVSNIINGATRLQPCVLLTGQAAGAMAALSVLNKKNVREIEIRKLQQSLLDAGAWLMPLFDVSAEDKDFQSIQRIAACGILKVKGESHNWANRTWFYPDSTLIIREMLEGLNAFDQKITVENDSSRLTVQKAAEFLSRLLNKNVLSEVQGILGTGMKGKLDIQSTITKREIAVLIDRLIHPFETKSIGFDGNYR